MLQERALSIDPSILDEVSSGLCVLRSDFVIVHWNRFLADWTGLASSAMRGRSLLECLPSWDEPAYRDRLRAVFEGGPPALFRADQHPQLLPVAGSTGACDFLCVAVRAIADASGHALVTFQAAPERIEKDLRRHHGNVVHAPEPNDEEVRRSIRMQLHELGVTEDPVLQAQVLADFDNSALELSDTLREALVRNDRDTLVAASHRLCGAARILGAVALSDQAGQLEKRAGALPKEALDRRIDALLDELESVRQICLGLS